MVVYDGPGAAMRDAMALLGEPGATPRLGLQIAEVTRGPTVDGPGVAGAVRLAERAGPGELLVSPAVRDLVAGSALSLVAVGVDAYRAVPPTASR